MLPAGRLSLHNRSRAGHRRPGHRTVQAGASGSSNTRTAPYSAPSAGPPPWHLYRFTFHIVSGVATAEPYGATRRRFDR